MKQFSLSMTSLCVFAVPWTWFLPCYWLSEMAFLSRTSTAHFFIPHCPFNCSSPYFPLTYIPSLLVSCTVSTLPFFATLVWQKKTTYLVSQKKEKKSKQAWSRQAQHKTCLCSWSLKTISFELGVWVGSRGCASFVLIQYFSIRGCGSLWVSTVGFYCCVRYYSS